MQVPCAGPDSMSPGQEGLERPRLGPVLRQRLDEDQCQAGRYQRLDPAPRTRK